MDQRVRFISEHLTGYFAFKDLCAQFGVSRNTGYKWVKRYAEFGSVGLADRSRKPHHCPHGTEKAVIEGLLRERSKHPSWGPKKLLAVLLRRHPAPSLPDEALSNAFQRGWTRDGTPNLSNAMDEVLREAQEFTRKRNE